MYRRGGTFAVGPAADYDGDGKTDVGYFRPSTGQWFALKATGGVALSPIVFGVNGHVPVPSYYDADARADIAIWNPINGQIIALPSGGGANIVKDFGAAAGDAPVGKRPSPPGYPY